MALAAVGLFAFASIFGFFSVYDDEGYNVAMIRLVAQGVPLYTGQFAYHGPLPYLVKAGILNALHIPVTHESVRFGVLAVWLLSSWIGAAAIRNLIGNRIVAIGGLIAVGVHLFPLRFNPGHPEDFVVLFLVAALWVVSAKARWLTENVRAAMLGLIAAALLGTKINVGILFALGLGAWFLALLPKTGAWRVASVGWVLACAATPTVLMHGAWAPEWQLLAISTAVICITCYAAFFPPFPAQYAWNHAAVCAAGALLGVGGIVGLAALSGSHPRDVLNGAVLTAAKHPSVFLRPMTFGILAIPVMAVFVVLSLRQIVKIKPGAELSRNPQTILKIAVASAAFLLVGLTDSRFYFPLIGPVCWLVMSPGAGGAISEQARAARVFLAFAAVFQILQVFPIIGTQTAWSTLFLCITSVVLLHDGIVELVQRRPGNKRAIALSVALGAGVASYALISFTMGLWNDYSRRPSLGLENSTAIRIPMATKANLDWLVSSTDRYCDVLLTQPGMDSFLLWSKNAVDMRRSPVLISGWPLILTTAQEQETIGRVIPSRRVCAIYNRAASEWWTRDDPQLTPARLSGQPLVAYIGQLEPVRQVGDYEVRANRVVAADWKDDYLLNEVRVMNGNRAAIGVPKDLLGHRDAELRFEFQATRNGLLVSLEQSGQDPSEHPDATEPIIYIARDGCLRVHHTDGSFQSLAPRRSVFDEHWHELVVRHFAQVWSVALDGGPAESIAELFPANRSPYLQLGPAFIEGCSNAGCGWTPFFGKIRDVRVTSLLSYGVNLGGD